MRGVRSLLVLVVGIAIPGVGAPASVEPGDPEVAPRTAIRFALQPTLSGLSGGDAQFGALALEAEHPIASLDLLGPDVLRTGYQAEPEPDVLVAPARALRVGGPAPNELR